MRFHFAILGACVGFGAPTLAQPTDSTPQIRVTGSATVRVQPDRAEVNVGVVTEAPEAQTAARQNAEKLDAVLKALRGALGSDAQFDTINYSLQPVYRYPERSEPVLAGYSASNTVRVKELALDKVGEAIDVATSSGANTVHNIQFGLKDEATVKARALREAATDARAKADALADALGLKVTGVLSLVEGEPDVVRPMPMYRAEMAMAQAPPPPTPVEPGTIEFRAIVTLVVGIRP